MQVTRYVTPINPAAEINGLNVRADINAIFAAIRDDNAGPTAPANPGPGMRWRDTSVNPPVLRFRNAENTGWNDGREDLGGPGGFGLLPMGIPFPVMTHLAGVQIPSNAGTSKFIRLSAGLTGVGQYNHGLLGSESVTGTAPLVRASATILVGPMAGGTVALINTEQSHLRPGVTSGVFQQDAFQGHWHNARQAAETGGTNVISKTSLGDFPDPGIVTFPVSDGVNGTPRTANETRVKAQTIEYFARIV